MAKYVLHDLFEGNYRVSQKYGVNASYYKKFGFAGHEGVDWATSQGVKILAPFDGIVLRDNDNPKGNAYGNHIVFWSPKQKCAVWFCHLKYNYVTRGQSASRGRTLGVTGNSGNSTGPHLHVNFVETDAIGNRLNLSNGYKGFLNILDPKLITWKISR